MDAVSLVSGGTTGAIAIAEALKTNSTLTTRNLSNGSLSTPSID